MNWSNSPAFGRRETLTATLELLADRCTDPLIVEIGGSADYSPDGLGNAILAFTFFAGTHGGRIKSVDIRFGESVRRLLVDHVPQFADIPEFAMCDAIDWIANLHERVGLIYMDAGDDPAWYLNLWRKIDPSCFQSGSLLLFDDTDPVTYTHKGATLVPYLLQNGWRKIPVVGVPVFPMTLLEMQ
jgi:hypothetical protein